MEPHGHMLIILAQALGILQAATQTHQDLLVILVHLVTYMEVLVVEIGFMIFQEVYM